MGQSIGTRAVRGWYVAASMVSAAPTMLVAQTTGHDSTFVRVTGSGPTTYVLINGVVGGVAGFRRLATLLERDHRVVAIDPYGLALDSTDVTFAALARIVDVVLVAHGVDSAQVVGHAHGAGVALRLAANSPQRVGALYFLDVGALAESRTKTLSSSVKLVSLVARLPGGRGLVRGRVVRSLRENVARREWLDSTSLRAYTEPFLEQLPKALAMAKRLSRAREPESRAELIARVRVPVSVLLGAVPHPAAPDSSQLEALSPLGGLLRIERLPGVGHFPHEEAAGEVVAFLLAPRQWTEAGRWLRSIVRPPVNHPRDQSTNAQSNSRLLASMLDGTASR